MDSRELRIKAINARRALSAEERAAFSRKICRKLLELESYKSAQTIFAYASTWDEVDLSEFCEEGAKQGKTVAYPISYKGGIMDAWAPSGPQDWIDGILGIRVPDKEKSRPVRPEEFDLVLVPLVAFDEDRNRLGHGAGYYDRYLPQCTKAFFVAVAFEAQKVESITKESHDFLVNLLVTEQGIY